MNVQRLGAVAFALSFISAAQPAVADSMQAEGNAVMATIDRYANAFNRGDAQAEVAQCASPASILDDFPPHAWQGPTACADWAKDFAATAAAGGSSDQHVTLQKPWHVTVDGNTAYVVYPTAYTYKLHGKPTKEMGIWTLALRKTTAGWRIVSWAWADR
jgi:ketosteroid isomerase-like protein